MKKILLSLILFSQLALSYDVNSISKLKPVWQDFAFTLNHQVSLMAGFGRVDSYLCLVNNTDYENYGNSKDSNGTSIGYVAKLDEASCGQVPIAITYLYCTAIISIAIFFIDPISKPRWNIIPAICLLFIYASVINSVTIFIDISV